MNEDKPTSLQVRVCLLSVRFLGNVIAIWVDFIFTALSCADWLLFSSY